MDITSNKYMKTITKKLIGVAASLALASSVFAQSTATPIMRFIPLLTGYNVLLATNVTSGLGVTNILFSNPQGQIVYSLTNNSYNGTLNTNLTVGDAFKAVTFAVDVNGDINANASLFISVGNTNLIPVAVTNSFGQYFVTNWPLAQAQYPNWMYPGTTNLYPAFTAAQSTNQLTVTLIAGIGDIRGTGYGPVIGNPYPLWETTGTFTCVVTPNGVTPVNLFTNLPTGFLQHAHKVYATITPTVGGTGNGILLNQLGILQPQ